MPQLVQWIHLTFQSIISLARYMQGFYLVTGMLFGIVQRYAHVWTRDVQVMPYALATENCSFHVTSMLAWFKLTTVLYASTTVQSLPQPAL